MAIQPVLAVADQLLAQQLREDPWEANYVHEVTPVKNQAPVPGVLRDLEWVRPQRLGAVLCPSANVNASVWQLTREVPRRTTGSRRSQV